MLKRGRLYIYFSVALIIVAFNFIYELEFSSLREAVFESLVIYPLVLVFIYVVYIVRGYLFNTLFRKKGYLQDSTRYKIFIAGVVIVKTLLISSLAHMFTNFVFSDEEESIFFDLTFVAILTSVLVVILFVYFFEEYLSSIQDKHKMAMELSNYEGEKMIAKYHALKKQLNPHFLFNSFNSLITLIPVNPAKAEKFVEELSNIFRYNLSKSDDLVVKLSEELDMIHSYIHLQKIRFGNALLYEETSNCDKDKLLLPPMTLQLLVENAIKHNKINKIEPLMITVLTEGNVVTVQNNLNLKEKREYRVDSFGIGLNNLRNQLRLITNTPLHVEESDKFYTVRVPLINTELDD